MSLLTIIDELEEQKYIESNGEGPGPDDTLH